MKIYKSSSSHYQPVLVLLSIVILGAMTLAILEKMHITDFIKTGFQTVVAPTTIHKKDQQEEESSHKKAYVETPESTTPPTLSPEVGIELFAKRGNNDTVIVTTRLHGVADGTCTLMINNNSITYTQKASVVYQPDFSSCAGFSVPFSKLGKGTWEIQLSLDTAGETKTMEYIAE